jgi:signal transduction histidine kinase
MPEEEIHKIAEAFYMVDKSRARREGGAGLGMAICERIVKAHHADWTIESKEGQGTRITVLFPAAEVADEG